MVKGGGELYICGRGRQTAAAARAGKAFGQAGTPAQGPAVCSAQRADTAANALPARAAAGPAEGLAGAAPTPLKNARPFAKMPNGAQKLFYKIFKRI